MNLERFFMYSGITYFLALAIGCVISILADVSFLIKIGYLITYGLAVLMSQGIGYCIYKAIQLIRGK